jgi:TFIIH basal transcription factor complex TTD-A subunit
VVIARLGVLIECDPSIKSIIMNIDSDKNDYVIEDLDDSHLLIVENKVQLLKQKLDEVCPN